MLELDDLHVHYGNIQALDGISLRVDEGELVALIGSNGAGKSTVLKAISGLVRPSRGTIRYLGEEITRLPTDRIVKLGISHCPDGRRILGPLTVRAHPILGCIQRPPPGVQAHLGMACDIVPPPGARIHPAGGHPPRGSPATRAGRRAHGAAGPRGGCTRPPVDAG